MQVEQNPVLPEEILWSVLKGHWGSKAATQALIASNSRLLHAPDLTAAADRDALRTAAASESGCPAVAHALHGDHFRRARVQAGEFVTAVSINEPHHPIWVLAQYELASRRSRGQLAAWTYYQAAASRAVGDSAAQGALVWDGGVHDPVDFQRTVLVEHTLGLMIFEGVNRATGIAAAILDGALDPRTEFRVYALVKCTAATK